MLPKSAFFIAYIPNIEIYKSHAEELSTKDIAISKGTLFLTSYNISPDVLPSHFWHYGTTSRALLRHQFRGLTHPLYWLFIKKLEEATCKIAEVDSKLVEASRRLAERMFIYSFLR